MNFILFNPFQKGYVRSHTRKGKQVGPYFTKRQPGQVQAKHTRDRFIDHDKASATKAHEELESLKAKHQELLDSAKKHHDELKSKGSSEGKVDHNTKLSHLKTEIKNQKTHIENHSRKQNLIRDRYKISSKQIVQRKSKSDLERKIANHSDGQKKTIRSIHKAHKEGSPLEPTKILKGKDKDHIYLETKHADTGATHHIAIHKDGTVKDPNILHGGKFEAKGLTEDSGQKKIVVKEPKKEITVKKQEDPQITMKMALGMSRSEAISAIEEENKIRKKAPKIKTLSQKVKPKKIVVNTDGNKGPVDVGTFEGKPVSGEEDLRKIEEKTKRQKAKKIVVKKTGKPIKKTNLFDKPHSEILKMTEEGKITIEDFHKEIEKAAYKHNGHKVYPILTRDSIKWGAQSVKNKMAGKPLKDSFGDGLFKTKKEAEKEIDLDIKQTSSVKKRQSEDEKETKEKTDSEAKGKAKRSDLDGFTDGMDAKRKGKVEKDLDRKIAFNGIDNTIRDKIKKLNKEGTLKVSTYETNKVKDMSRKQAFRATTEDEKWHKIKQEDAGKKTVYQVSGFEIGKTAYDYASHLLKNKKLKKSFPTTSKQLENLLQSEKLAKSLKSPEEIKLLKDKRKRRKKRKNKR